MKFNTNLTITLASASPRRKELFGMLQLPFETVVADVEEQSIQFITEQQYVSEVALLKARHVAKKLSSNLIIGADTIVAFEGKLLHKPKSEAEAIAHLQSLSGKTHEVYTAVVVIHPQMGETTFVEKTSVTFKQLSDALIEAYVATKDPFDKAGGYGIQTAGALLVDKIDGDYNAVVGLPIASLTERLLSLNYITI